MKRSALVCLLAAIAFAAGPVRADRPDRKKGAAVVEKNAASDYFVQDENDPSVLHVTPAFAARGFDAGYLRLMARPHIEPTDEQLAKPPVFLHAPADLPAPNPFADTGDVLVIPGTADMYTNTGDFDAGGNALFEVAQLALEQLGDNYDFIAVYTTTQVANNNFAAFYAPLKNDTQGLGDCVQNSSETFGCQFDSTGGQLKQLQGMLFMNSPSFWQDWDNNVDGTVHPFTSFDSNAFAVLGQETAHRWGSALRFVDKRTHAVSKKLLGRDLSHWAAFVDTNASVMDGWDWVAEGGGKFKVVNDMDIYSTLDLYTMGALPVAAADPFFFIDNATYDISGPQANFLSQLQGNAIGAADVLELGLPSVKLMQDNGVVLGGKGTEVDLTIQDIVNAEGNRCPDPDHTQRAFREAFVLVTKPGEAASTTQSVLSDMQTITATWQKWWQSRTNNAVTLCTVQSQDPDACLQPLMTLGGGSLDSQGGHSFIERGETATLHMSAGAIATYPVEHTDPNTGVTATTTTKGGVVKNAHLSLSLDSEGSHHARLPAEDIPVGDINPGQVIDVPVKVVIDSQYNCGDTLTVVGTLHADNAPDVVEAYRLFPGSATTFFESFGNPGDKFHVNGTAAINKGALKREDVELSCNITPRTPETDNTPGSKGAYVTTGDLSGATSLISPPMDLSQAADPEIAFDLWLQGDPGDSMTFELSTDDRNFVKALDVSDAAHHKWLLQRINVKDVLGKVPSSVIGRWTFTGNGHLAGGVDNVRVIDPHGQCLSIVNGFCGCTTDGSAAPQSTLALVLGLLGLRVLRRRVK